MNYNDRVDGCYRVLYTPTMKGVVGYVNVCEAITYITIKSSINIDNLNLSLVNSKGSVLLATFENVEPDTVYYSSVYLSSVPMIKSKVIIDHHDKFEEAIIHISIGIINV